MGLTIIRRIINKQSFFKPHKLHIYQRLSQAGFSHRNISLIYATAVLILCIFSSINNIFIFISVILFEFIIGVYLSSIAVPFE